jgi:magnesium and cobalt transporter
MGDTPDDSSSAAHGAHDPEDPAQTGGFLSRLSFFFGASDEDDAEEPHEHDGSAALPGMGNLRAMRVEDVAIPRVEITAVPVDIDLEALVGVFRESGNTRLPVYEGTLDAPLGMIHLKDLALKHGFNGNGHDEFDLRGLMRPLLYAPPSMPLGVLLQKMQTDRSHMALVIDEYGGVDGLVTIEDLIEQVIGEIEDEHDIDDEALWSEEKPGCFAVAARAPIDAFEEATGLKLVEADEDEEIDTLGGLVFMLAGRVPARGEVIAHPSGAQIEVIDADPRRIKRLRVRVPGAGASARPIPLGSAAAPQVPKAPLQARPAAE